MRPLSATIRLRPARIALLTRPSDLGAIRSFMRLSVCMWGGAHHPIIPVFKVTPRVWRERHWRTDSPASVTRGYIEHFEPDAYVEAKPGLLEEAGLGRFRESFIARDRVVSLASLFSKQRDRDWAEPAFGTGIINVLRHVYEKEQRFELKRAHKAVQVRPLAGTGLSEAMFGVFPRGKAIDYVREGYEQVYSPEIVAPTPACWQEVFVAGALTPLRLTRHGLDEARAWHDDLVLFLFDPASPLDLIDLWNMRLDPRPVLPVPIDWWSALAGDVARILRAEHRPIRGNPQGLMHHATIELARSIGEERGMSCISALGDHLEPGLIRLKSWRNPIWRRADDQPVWRERRLTVTAEEKRAELTVEDERGLTTRFVTLEPDFATRFGGNDLRWINVLSIDSFHQEAVATALPYNHFDPEWPRLQGTGDPVMVGTEGWAFGERYIQWQEYVSLLKPEQALIEWLGRQGVEARLSEPGHVAKQVLEHVGGLWGLNLLKDPATLEMLNRMAGGVRRRGEGEAEVEELFDRRSKSVSDWNALVKRRRQRRLPDFGVEDFTKRNVIRLGLQTRCPHCQAANWHSLTGVDYEVICERCQKGYPFPQAQLRPKNGNWSYRVVGPFAVPDYARGAYGALLAVNVISGFDHARDRMTFSTALALKFEGFEIEADYMGWRTTMEGGGSGPPELVIGEAKSFGQGELIKRGDLARLRQLAVKLPGAAFAISVMRDSFTSKEHKLLIPFVNWCRRPNELGEPMNPVILLTSHELFHDHSVRSQWEKLGGRHAKFADYHGMRSLRSFAESTQQLYLNLPPSFEARLRRRPAGKAAGAKPE